MVDVFNLLIIFLAGISSGIFGTLTGGAGLITISALIFLGLPPHSAIGTHFFGVTGINIAGWYKFHQKEMINYKIGLILTGPVFLGCILGANIGLQIGEAVLKKIIAILTILILFFITLRPNIGIEGKKETIRRYDILGGFFLAFLWVFTMVFIVLYPEHF